MGPVTAHSSGLSHGRLPPALLPMSPSLCVAQSPGPGTLGQEKPEKGRGARPRPAVQRGAPGPRDRWYARAQRWAAQETAAAPPATSTPPPRAPAPNSPVPGQPQWPRAVSRVSCPGRGWRSTRRVTQRVGLGAPEARTAWLGVSGGGPLPTPGPRRETSLHKL